MAIYRDEEDVVVREDRGNGVASNFIWAITSIIIIGMLIWAIFYSGMFKSNPVRKIGVDVNVSAPVNR